MERILLLGGTSFVGRNLVEKLISLNRYEICLFNRGTTNSNLFAAIELIKGDRNTTDVKQITEHDWDYIIDVSCYYPSSLEAVLACLKSKPKRYIFISTCSVYDNEASQELLRNETAAILSCSEDQKVDRTMESYGNRKAECERILNASGIAHSIFRPALIYGKYDPTDRLYYWLYQSKLNKEVLLPEGGKMTFSTTYISDLVNAVVSSLGEKDPSTVYNLTTTPQNSLLQLVETATKLLATRPILKSIDKALLDQEAISQWSGMPLWLHGHFFTYTSNAAKEKLNFKPTSYDESFKETIAYYDQLNWHKPSFGITEEKRQSLLKLIS